MPRRTRSEAGARGEDYACALLRGMGMAVLARNYRSPWGEIDIVALDGDNICFVEVKSRSLGAMVDGAAAVTPAKQRKLIKTALCYLQEFPGEYQPRFDVLALTADKSGGFCHEHYPAAFDGGDHDES